jgi:lysozyme
MQALSEGGLNFLKRWERYRGKPYNDGYGNMTIGYGHVILPGEKFTEMSEPEAAALLAKDAAWAASVVNQLVQVPLTSSQFDALTSLVFNWGAGNFRNSSHLALLNSGDYAGAARRLREHPITSGGQRSQGLVNRRAAEADLFARDGIYGLAEMREFERQARGESAPAPAPAPAPTSAPTPAPGDNATSSQLLPFVVIGGLLFLALAWD